MKYYTLKLKGVLISGRPVTLIDTINFAMDEDFKAFITTVEAVEKDLLKFFSGEIAGLSFSIFGVYVRCSEFAAIELNYRKITGAEYKELTRS